MSEFLPTFVRDQNRTSSASLTVVRAAFLGLPLVLMVFSHFATPGPLDFFLHLAGGFALLVAPGYAVLYALGLDPIGARNPEYRWVLLIPLSLAVGVLVGMFLVLTPIGLSACSLWTSMSVVIAVLVITRRCLC